MSFSYRLRVRANSGITTDKDSVQITISGLRQPIEVSAAKGTLSAPKWLLLRAGGFSTREAANEKGQRLQRTLMLAGLKAGFGIDVGEGKVSGQFSNRIKEAVRAVRDGELRDTLHGLDVFEGSAFYVETDARGSTSFKQADWQKHIASCLPLAGHLTDRQKIAASLINDSEFNPNPDVQFLLRITAVEALCEQEPVGEGLANSIDGLVLQLDTLLSDEEHRSRIKERVLDLKRRSPISAFVRKVTRLLGKDRAHRYRELYDLRSEFVHDGKHRGALGENASEARSIAVDLLFADISEQKKAGSGG